MRFRQSLTVLLSCLFAAPAFASFHLMQIEQVIGGVDGNTNVQAIQLRMRGAGQNLVSGTRLVVRDAAGANPVVLVTMGVNAANSAAGSRILLASSQFASNFGPAPDFLLSNLIPNAYLAAGKLSFEDAGGNIYWAVAWGGGGYIGANTGLTDNDADGNFNPPFGGPLPSSGTQSLLFSGAANAPSTNNAADYALSAGDAEFTNNSGVSGPPVPVELIEFSID